MIIVSRLWEPTTLGTSLQTLYTSGGKTILKRVVLNNTNGSAQTVTVHIVPRNATAGTANMILDAVSINANTPRILSELDNMVMDDGDTLQASASLASVVSAFGSGSKVS